METLNSGSATGSDKTNQPQELEKFTTTVKYKGRKYEVGFFALDGIKANKQALAEFVNTKKLSERQMAQAALDGMREKRRPATTDRADFKMNEKILKNKGIRGVGTNVKVIEGRRAGLRNKIGKIIHFGREILMKKKS